MFSAWLKLRGEAHLLDQPTEDLYGRLLLFFSNKGIRMGSEVTDTGRMRSTIYTQAVTGFYRHTHTSNIKMEVVDVMEYSVIAAFSVLDRKMKMLARPMTDHEVSIAVGLDVEAVLSRKRKAVYANNRG